MNYPGLMPLFMADIACLYMSVQGVFRYTDGGFQTTLHTHLCQKEEQYNRHHYTQNGIRQVVVASNNDRRGDTDGTPKEDKAIERIILEQNQGCGSTGGNMCAWERIRLNAAIL